MKNLLSLLERFSKSLNKDTFTKEAIVSVIHNRTKILLAIENLSLKEGVLEIVSSPAVNNEIRLKEDVIRDELKEVHKLPIRRVIYK